MSLIRSVFRGILKNAPKLIHPRISSRTIYQLPPNETHEEFVQRYECYFCRQDIDGWDVRQAMNDLAGMDLIPDPRIIIAALYACRRINEYAITVRFLECIKNKCGDQIYKIYPYILQEIAPTLSELGIDTPEALGYERPEFFLPPTDDYYAP